MKLPNHYGTVSKLSGNRRRPFAVREGTSGKQKVIGYASTREEGLQLLAQYHQDPWDFDRQKITFAEVFSLWLEKRACKLGEANQHSLKSVYKHCKSLEKMTYHQIKAYHMQDCIDDCGLGYATQSAIKNLFCHLDKLALELDIISKAYSGLLTTEAVPDTKKTIFTKEEREQIWASKHLEWTDSLLIFLYTGFRISELLDLKKSQVDLENQTITGGCKTAAGKNRVVPIHSKILPLVTARMEQEGDYLLSVGEKKCTESQYRTIWKKLMDTLAMSHKPHECRHTFRSLLDSAGANPVCIDRLMGHKSKSVGERVYTHKTLEELKSNLELVTC